MKTLKLTLLFSCIFLLCGCNNKKSCNKERNTNSIINDTISISDDNTENININSDDSISIYWRNPKDVELDPLDTAHRN